MLTRDTERLVHQLVLEGKLSAQEIADIFESSLSTVKRARRRAAQEQRIRSVKSAEVRRPVNPARGTSRFMLAYSCATQLKVNLTCCLESGDRLRHAHKC